MTLTLAQAQSRGLSTEQAAAVMAELTAILASDSFSSSHRCRDFLEFVVKHALAGDYQNLTERFLGVELFGRAVDYETATDSIVRVRANDVRKRLALYYAGPPFDTQVKIDLIAGGYVPEFHWRKEDKVASSFGLGRSEIEHTIPEPGTPQNQRLTSGSEGKLSLVAKHLLHSKIFWWV